MVLPITRTTSNTPAEHVSDHNIAHGLLNDLDRSGALLTNVKHWNVTGDGVADDTATIQTAINAAAAAGGGEIVFAPGTYSSTGLVIPAQAHDITLRGQGAKIVRRTSVGTNPNAMLMIGSAAWADAAYRITVRDLFFDGNERNLSNKYGEDSGQPTNDGPVHTGITFNCSWDVRVLNSDFYDIAREGIWLTTVRNTAGLIDHTDILVDGCRFERMGYLTTIESSQRVTFSNNFGYDFRHTGTTGPGYAISLNWLDMRDIVIKGNVLEGAGGFTNGIVQNVGTTDATIDGVVISDNTVSGFSGYQAMYAVRCLVTGNTVARNNTPWGIRCGSGAQVIGNRVEKNHGAGIVVDDDTATVANVLIANNVVHSNNAGNHADQQRCGILLGGDTSNVSYVQVIGNKVYDLQSPKQQYAIGTNRGVGGVTYCTITNNDFQGNVGVDGRFFATNVVGQTGVVVSENPGFPGSAYTVSNGSTDRALNVTADTTPQVAAVLGTLIGDLKAAGILS